MNKYIYVRGGCWYDDARIVHTEARYDFESSTRFSVSSFRIVRSFE